MPKLLPLKSKEVISKLKKLGFEGPEYGGRHAHMIRGKQVIPVPVHGGQDIGVGLISMIIKEVGVERDEWIKL